MALGVIGTTATAIAEVGPVVSNYIWENGTQTNSETTWRGKGKERIDVENPAPGKRDRQIHYHGPNNEKHMFDFSTGTFSDITKRLKRLLADDEFKSALKKHLSF